jgi:hypothetical protein
MTFVEMLVGLTVLALMLGLVFGGVGPWLSRGRMVEREAAFWRDVEAAQFTVSELAFSAIDTPTTLRSSGGTVRFRTVAPRLSLEPVDVEIAVVDDTELVLRALSLEAPAAVLLADGPTLRIRPVQQRRGRSTLVVEADLERGWTPILSAPFSTNAPLTCVFDYISRACR